jgi:hypothetical protein
MRLCLFNHLPSVASVRVLRRMPGALGALEAAPSRRLS